MVLLVLPHIVEWAGKKNKVVHLIGSVIFGGAEIDLKRMVFHKHEKLIVWVWMSGSKQFRIYDFINDIYTSGIIKHERVYAEPF